MGYRGAARWWSVAALAMLASACSDDNDAPAAEPADRAPAEQPGPADPYGAAQRIGDDGIGVVRAGMTIGQLRAALPPGQTLEPAGAYMVDIDAMPVVHDGDTLYSVLIVSGEASDDEAAINLVATTNPTFRTAEGIGPGSTLAEAAAAYGPPTLSYNTDDESREYAMYPRAPRRLRFRVRSADDARSFAGVYPDATGYVETTRYDPNARIMMVMIHTR